MNTQGDLIITLINNKLLMIQKRDIFSYSNIVSASCTKTKYVREKK